MAGYIGNKSSVTLVDGYNEAEADAEFVTKTGDSMTGNLSLGDNNKAIFGAGSDLQIYHSGSASVIQDSGDGSLFLQGGSQIVLGNVGNSESYAIFNQDGAVQLRHNNAQKFATTSTGIQVTGNIANASGDLTLDASGILNLDSAFSSGTTGGIIRLADAGTQFGDLYEDSGNFLIASAQVDKDIIFKGNDGGSIITPMTIDMSAGGKVGIGTSSPSRNLTVSSSGQTDLAIIAASGSSAQLCFGDGDDDNVGQIEYSHPTDSMRLYTQGSERMRIHAEGDVLIGQTTQTNGHGKIQLSGRNGHHCATFKNGNDGGYGLVFRNTSASQVGTITWTASSTSYNTSSDYRLKENVVDLTGASARVNQLKPARFNWISDDTDTLIDGFLAHEVATVIPEAITGTKDAMRDEEYEVTPATGDIYTPATDDVDEVIHSTDAEQPETLEDGQLWRENTAAVMGTRSVPDYQGIDQSKLVPLLTAALQEALTEIASLKTRVEALEA
jgi:hypothetical protein